jgi:CTP:molybdopterin cytidylyltransferase MocA
VLLSRPVFRDIETLAGDVGAKALMDRHPESVGYVDVDDDVPRDIDSPGDVDAFTS